MSIVTALIVVLVVATLIAKFYPHPKQTTSNSAVETAKRIETQLDELISHVEQPVVEEPQPEVVAEVIPTTPPSTPTMKAKPKKKPVHKKPATKKAPAKTKVNA